MSGWSGVRDFINSKEVGHIFTRKELILLGNLNELRPSTIDTMRNTMIRSGFLKWLGRGKYELVNKIPIGSTLAELTALAFGSNLIYMEKVLARKERETRFDKAFHDFEKGL